MVVTQNGGTCHSFHEEEIDELLAKNIARTAVTVKWAMREMLLAIFCRAKTFLYLIGGVTI